MSDSNNKSSCLNCTEWEFFEGRGYGCFCMQTMTPIDAENCEFYHNKNKEFFEESEATNEQD